MKLIRSNTDLNKAINKENDLGFVPTMGCIHKGHESLIKISKSRCKKTLVSIFVNPKQFNKRNDYITYPRNLHKDLKILRKLKVDFVYLPTKEQIFKKKLYKIILNKNQKILCAKYRKGHFEGVLDILDRFVNLISPRIMFMGEKDYQQYFLVKNFISKKYKTKVVACKTIRNSKGVALSSRNILLSNSDIKIAGSIANDLVKTKYLIRKKNNIKNKKSIKIEKIMQKVKKSLSQIYKIKIEYLECRNTINLNTKILNKPFKIFIAFYLNKVRLIDNF